MALLTEALDFHQLPTARSAGGLKWIGPAANDDGCFGGRRPVNDRPGSTRRSDRLASPCGKNSRKGDVGALQRAQYADAQPRRRTSQRCDQFIRALITLSTFADAAVHD